MKDPFTLLGVEEDVDDETLRKAYLRLVRIFSPERNPARFQEIRDAYESIAQEPARLAYRFFQAPKADPTAVVAVWLTSEEKLLSVNGQDMLSLLTESMQHFRLPTNTITGKK